MALPMFVGKMIYVGNWAAMPVPRSNPGRLDISPEFLLGIGDIRHDPSAGARVVFRDISNSTNERSFVSALTPGLFPCGNSLPVLEPTGVRSLAKLELAAYLSSLPFDWSTRQRMSGTHLNWHVAESLGLPPPESAPRVLGNVYAKLALSSIHFASEWLHLSEQVGNPCLHASSPHDRLRVAAMVHAAIAVIMGFSISDLRHALAQCDFPHAFRGAKQPKGLWRVDKDKDPELRHTVLTLVAFHDLQKRIESASAHQEEGMEAFLTQNHGEGWLLPERLRLADYGLGHDQRAKQPQPVARRLGPRFCDWQLARSPEESWRECHVHARNLLGEHGYRQLLAELGGGEAPVEPLPHRYPSSEPPSTAQPLPRVAEPSADYQLDTPSQDRQSELFE